MMIYLLTISLGTIASVATYSCVYFLYGRLGRISFLNPVFMSVLFLSLVLYFGRFDVVGFQASSGLLLTLLPMCVCALSMPIYRRRREIARHARTLFAAVFGVTLCSGISVVLLGFLLHRENAKLVGAMLPKSITGPVAQDIAFAIGVDASLGGAVAISTGICGSVFGSMLLKRFARQHPEIGGIAIGASTHGIATAQLFSEKHHVAGTYAGLAMALCALFGALALPFLWFFLNPLLFG